MSAELMKSKFVRRLSVCGIDYLWTYCMDFFQILVVAFRGPYARAFFFFNFGGFFFVLIFYEYFSFSLTWNTMGVKIQNPNPTNRSQKFRIISRIFLPMVLTKLLSGFLKFWVSDF